MPYVKQSLFDQDPEPVAGPAPEQEEQIEEWREVPQRIFLTWTPQQQLEYCRIRDLDAAVRPENEHIAKFLLDRADRYQKLSERFQS